MELRDRLLDPSKTRRGVWMTYEGAEFLVRHLPNSEATAAQFAYYEEWRAANGDKQEIPDEVRSQAINVMMSKCVLLDWRGVTLDGKGLEATEVNRLMVVEGDPDLRSWVLASAFDKGHFRQERIQKEAESLGNASSGASRGGRASKNSKP